MVAVAGRDLSHPGAGCKSALPPVTGRRRARRISRVACGARVYSLEQLKEFSPAYAAAHGYEPRAAERAVEEDDGIAGGGVGGGGLPPGMTEEAKLQRGFFVGSLPSPGFVTMPIVVDGERSIACFRTGAVNPIMKTIKTH